MPEWLTVALAILGGGLLTGVGSFLRARGQNRVEAAKLQMDDRSLLFKDTREWLAYQDAQIDNLIKRDAAKDARLLDLTEKLAGAVAEIAELQRQNTGQAAQIAHLSEQNTSQAAQIATLTEERQQYIERLKIAETQRAVIERECNDLREENRRLRGVLPARVEVTD